MPLTFTEMLLQVYGKEEIHRTQVFCSLSNFRTVRKTLQAMKGPTICQLQEFIQKWKK